MNTHVIIWLLKPIKLIRCISRLQSFTGELSMVLWHQAQTTNWELFCPWKKKQLTVGESAHCLKDAYLPGTCRGHNARGDASPLRNDVDFVFVPVCSHRRAWWVRTQLVNMNWLQLYELCWESSLVVSPANYILASWFSQVSHGICHLQGAPCAATACVVVVSCLLNWASLQQLSEDLGALRTQQDMLAVGLGHTAV